MMKQRGFQLINPTEKWFPGLMAIRENLASWDWCFGKTPKFTVQKDLQLKSDDKEHDVQLRIDVNAVCANRSFWNCRYHWQNTRKHVFLNSLVLSLFRAQGIIEDVVLALPNYEPIPVVTSLKGKPYTEDNLGYIITALKGVSTDNVRHVMNNSL